MTLGQHPKKTVPTKRCLAALVLLLLTANLLLLAGCRPSHVSQSTYPLTTTTSPHAEQPTTSASTVTTVPTVPTLPPVTAPVPALAIASGNQVITSLVTAYDWAYMENESEQHFVQDPISPLSPSIFPALPHLDGDAIAAALQFGIKADSITVRCWPIHLQGNDNAYDQYQIATVINNQIQLKEGIYIYEVEALWYVGMEGYGTVYYAFTASCNSSPVSIEKTLTITNGQQTITDAWECMVQQQLYDDAGKTWLYEYGLSGYETLLWNLSIVTIPEVTLSGSIQIHTSENGNLEKINVYRRLDNGEIALEMVNAAPANLAELPEGAYYLVIFISWKGRYIPEQDMYESRQSEYLLALNIPDKGEPKLQWDFDAKTGTLTVFGIERIPDFTEHSKDELPWVAMQDQIQHVVVATGTKRIGDFAFHGLENLKSITLPEGLEEIGQYAFCDAATLSSIIFPDSLKLIGRGAFTRCGSLQNLTFPASMEAIEHWAFAECHSIREVTVLGNLSVFNSAFNGCQALQIIRFCGDLPQNAYYSLEPYGNYVVYYPHQNTSWTDAFFADQNYTILWVASSDPAAENVTPGAMSGPCGRFAKWSLSDGVLTITGNGVWHHTPWLEYAEEIEKVVLEPGLTNIAVSAFYGCINLKEVSIPDSVVSIDGYSFYECISLSSISLPKNLRELGDATFYGCSSLETIVIPNGVTTIGNQTLWGCKALVSVTLPSALTQIGNGAFFGCTALTEITFPATLTTLGDSCFNGCTGLKKLYFYGNPPRVSNFTFKDVTATAYFPPENEQWLAGGMGFHSGNIAERPDPNLASNP